MRSVLRGCRLARVPACLLPVLCALAGAAGCAVGPIAFSGQSSPPVVEPAEKILRAGFARVDITPPPGPGLMGYGVEGDTARGYRNRLYARAMVLEDRTGERVAIVTLDLLAPSLALHRSVAELTLGSTGIGPDRLVLSATHTHAGPANHFAVRGLDDVGSSVKGFDPEMLRFLATRTARAVEGAAAGLEPARAAWSVEPLWGTTRIRTIEPFLKNVPRWTPPFPAPPGLPPDQSLVDPSWAMLRVDVLDRTLGEFRPRGAFSVFAIHGTGIPSGNDLFDSDIHGVVARRLEQRMDALAGGEQVQQGPGRRAVHLFANGAEGDVSPTWPASSRCDLPTLRRMRRPTGPRTPPSPEVWVPIPAEARHACMSSALAFVDTISDRLVEHALGQYEALEARLSSEILISRAFQVLPMLGSPEFGLLCREATVGVATAAGTADGRTRIHGWKLFGIIPFGFEEGGSARGRESPSHCHAPKKRLLHPIWPVLTGENVLPRVAQLTVLRIGGMLIGTVPGEPTTTAGGRMRAAMAEAAEHAGLRPDSVLLLGLTNGYIDYVTTPEEYREQYYEGASTLFGPYTAVALQDGLARLAATIPHAGSPSPAVRVPAAVAFPSQSKLTLLPLARRSDPVARTIDAAWRGDTLLARWVDQRPGGLVPADGPLLVVERRTAGTDAMVTWDDDLELEVRWMGGGSWEARWTPCVREAGDYFVVLLQRGALPAVRSDPAPAGARRCREAEWGSGGD